MLTPHTGSTIAEVFKDQTREIVEAFRSGYHDPSLGLSEAEAIKPFEILKDILGPKDSRFDGEHLDPMFEARMAVYYRNFLNRTKEFALQETSRDNMPTWVRNGLALISTIFAEDIIDQIISVQPMSNRMAKIHYLDIVTEAAKGNIAVGTKMFDAIKAFAGSQFYSDEVVQSEPLGASGATNYTSTLAYRPVIPGSLKLTAGALVVQDDGNGNLVGDTGAGTNTINYLSGAVDVDFSAATVAAVTGSYTYNVEAALQYPEVGVTLRQETVEARPRALSMTWSQQATFDFLNEFGIDTEPTLLDAGARVIRAEQFKHVVNFLRQAATGGTAVFDNSAPAGVPYSLHIKSFAFLLSRLQAAVWQATRTARPNKMVLSPDLWFLVAAQDGFQGEASTANDGVAGPRKIGTLTRHGIECFVDPTYPVASAFITHRGPDFATTAAIMGNYIPMYRSPIHAQGFRKDVTLLTEYVLHPIDTDQIALLSVVGL